MAVLSFTRRANLLQSCRPSGLSFPQAFKNARGRQGAEECLHQGAVRAHAALLLLLELIAARWVHPVEERGIVIQGGFRSNMGIIGLAYCVNAYGNQGLITASLYLALVTILFNVLSVITLSRSFNRGAGIRATLLGIAKNPLILGKSRIQANLRGSFGE